MYDEGKSLQKIADTVSRPRSSIQYVVEHFKETGFLEISPGRGRKKTINERVGRKIERIVKQDPKLSAVKIAGIIEEQDEVTVNAQTIRNFLHSKGYKARVPRRKPFISNKNVKLRLEYAKKYVNETEDFWKTVIFTDESKYNIFGSDGRRFVWRRENTALDPKNLKATMKHGGGSVMVWGAMSAEGVGNLVFVETTMDKTLYLNILEENLEASAEKMDLQGYFRFLHDNDPKHKSKVVTE